MKGVIKKHAEGRVVKAHRSINSSQILTCTTRGHCEKKNIRINEKQVK